MRIRVGVLGTIVGLFLATSAHAGHHLWSFTEAFSNSSGTVQFIEFVCAAAPGGNGENLLGAFSVTADANTFNFVTNLPSSLTGGTHMLLATAGFASLPGGVAPDYIIPNNFFATGGGTLGYGGVSTWAYGAVPTDGIHSLLRNGSTAVNSPTNFAGGLGSVNLATAVPALQTWGLIALAGAILLLASGLVTRRGGTATA